jgi:polar amino acid transport system substrate-binding protein
MPHLYFIRLIFCLLAFGVFSAQAQERVVRIAADEWPPMTGSELHEGGFSVHLAKEVLTDLGYKVTVEFMPWKRIMRTQARSDYDLIPAIWYSQERESTYAFTQAYLDNKIVFVSLKENAAPYTGLSSLQNKRIGIVSSYSYPQELLSYDQAKWQAGIDLNQNLKKLFGNRLDMVIGTDAVIRYEVQQNFDQAIPLFYHMHKPIEVRSLHMAITRTFPSHKILAKQIDEKIEQFKQDGRFELLKKQHGLE